MAARELIFDIFAVDRASKVFSKVGKEAEGLGGKTSGMNKTAGLAFAAVATAAVAFGAKSIDTFGRVAAETLKLKRYMGGTTEEASRFRYAATQSGIGGDALALSMGKLSKFLVLGGTNAAQTAKTMQLLGFSTKDAHGNILPMDQLMPKLADKFRGMPAGAEKTALALKLFGKAGMGMIPMLDKGSAGLKALGIESDKFGNTLNDKDTAAVKENIKQKRQMAAAMEGLQIMLGRVLMPAVVAITLHLSEMARWFNQNVKVMGPLLTIVGGLIVVIFTITKAMQAYAVVQGIVNAVMAMNPIGLVVIAVGLLIGAIVLIATKTTWFQTIWQYMTSSLAAAWQWLWNSILAPIIRFVLNGFASIVDGIAQMLSVLSNIPGFEWAKTAADKMSGAADKARALANGIKDIPEQKTFTLTIAAAISQQAAALISSTNKRAGMLGFATGTDYAPGGVALVGERGPELVNLPRGAQVIPNHKLGAAGRGVSIVNNIYETVSAQATAMQVSRRQAALGAV